MENRYPLFAGGRILKKESLWDLRDYAYESLKLQYEDYTDGILKGCRVHVEGQELVIGRGMMKYGDFICLMQNEERVPYRAENKQVVLKAVIEKRENNPDYLAYRLKFLLDDSIVQSEELELCRFHLREGAKLRDTYKDFADMGTEYDTVNLIHASVAGRGRERLHPEILQQFADELQKYEDKEMADYAFIYHIQNMAGEIDRRMVDAYLVDKLGRQVRENVEGWDSGQVFQEMTRLLGSGTYQNRSAWKKDILYVE